MNDIKLLAIDLAKNVFQLHGVNAQDKCILKKRVKRQELKEFVVNLPPCIIAMEACGSSHYWGRVFIEYGHEVKLIAPQFVKPYVLSNKNDANDARAIAEAASRPIMRFVGVKSQKQQTQLSLHKARQLAKKLRTSQSNQIRGLLAEYGITLPTGIHNLKKVPTLLDKYKEVIGLELIELFERLYKMFIRLDEEVRYYDKKIAQSIVDCPIANEILKIDGVGVMVASAITALIGDASKFKNGREVAAWLGLIPKQNSSGDRIKLGGISKRGDSYVRSLLIHGARATLRYAAQRNDKKSIWITKLKERSSYNNAAVALANKHVRIIWSIMKNGECYDANQAAA